MLAGPEAGVVVSLEAEEAGTKEKGPMGQIGAVIFSMGFSAGRGEFRESGRPFSLGSSAWCFRPAWGAGNPPEMMHHGSLLESCCGLSVTSMADSHESRDVNSDVNSQA